MAARAPPQWLTHTTRAQLVSWVATALLVLGFFGWQLPFLDGAAAAALAVLYVLVAGSVVGLAALITRSNPADPAVKALLAQAKGEGGAPPPQPAYNAERPFCDYCKTCVAPRTKHCRACVRLPIPAARPARQPLCRRAV